MNKAFLLLGTNLGKREENLKGAKDILQQYGNILRSSSSYETAPWGKTDQPFFLNQAIEIETILSAEALMQQILEIEKTMGRERKEKYGPRSIDIDILLFNDEQYDLPFLKIPHPEMQNRRFVLIPLAEIAPNVQHPKLNKSISRLLEACPDDLDVIKVSN